jgi:hypothetical protein
VECSAKIPIRAFLGTKLTYKADVQIGAPLASVGQRVIGGTIEKTVSDRNHLQRYRKLRAVLDAT